jgi:hypothetical protein
LEVKPMHVLQRPHLPRAIGVSVVAALLAIVITLLFATALGDLNQPGGAGTLARHPAPAAISVPRTVATPSLTSDPFTSLLSRSLPQPMGTTHR